LLLEASSHQAASDLYLEVAVESVDNSAPLTVGSNLYVRNWSTLRSRALVSSTLFYHDEISLDVTLLLQQIVERNLWNGNQFVTFRIRNDPLRPVQSSPGSRVVYSGLSCGANYGGGKKTRFLAFCCRFDNNYFFRCLSLRSSSGRLVRCSHHV
jgi:hypothetical protein